jgi:hypothetical protein
MLPVFKINHIPKAREHRRCLFQTGHIKLPCDEKSSLLESRKQSAKGKTSYLKLCLSFPYPLLVERVDHINLQKMSKRVMLRTQIPDCAQTEKRTAKTHRKGWG